MVSFARNPLNYLGTNNMITEDDYRITRKTLNKLFHIIEPPRLARKIEMDDQMSIVNVQGQLREVMEKQ